MSPSCSSAALIVSSPARLFAFITSVRTMRSAQKAGFPCSHELFVVSPAFTSSHGVFAMKRCCSSSSKLPITLAP